MKVKIWNYRNIPNSHPLEFSLAEGITFVLGPNNSGKSNLIHFFHDFRQIFKFEQLFVSHGRFKFNFQLQLKFFDQIINRKSKEQAIYFEVYNANGHGLRYQIKPKGDPHTRELEISSTLLNVGKGTNEARILLQEVSNFFKDTLIIGTYRTPLNQTAGESLDLQIGSSFINIWSEWSDGGEVSKMEKTDALVDELKRLFGYKTFEVRVEKDKSQLLIKTEDGTFYLKEFGNGIAQYMMILSKALMANPSYIFIDEPEISLHPKMQEIFVRALASKSRHGVFAASHSIALARSVADCIYTLSRDDDNSPHIHPYGEHYTPTISQVINEMSYSQYVEIGGNNILLVEGRTDIKSFREVLRKYNIENKFIILSFGGGQFVTKDMQKIIEELNEVKRLNAKSVNVIFDSEKTSTTAALKQELRTFSDACEMLGFRVFPTDRHSTENYISQSALDNVMGPGYSALTPFQSFSDSPKKWPKEKNWLMFLKMEKEDFVGTELHKFISTQLLPNC